MDIITNITLIVLMAALLLPTASRLMSHHCPRLERPMRYAVFAVYVLANLYETILFRTVTPDAHMKLQLLWSYRVAIQVTKQFNIQDFELLQEIILNILLYVPMGYLLPFTWPEKFSRRTPWLVILIGFCCSALTEVTQLVFHIGLFEFDDMLNNTLGTVLGAMIYMFWMRKGSQTADK